MSNIITAAVSESFELTAEASQGFTGEHNAETLEINISPLIAEGYDYYVLLFDDLSVSSAVRSNEIRGETDYPAYLSGETIVCPLSSQLTSTGRLRFQIEAHKLTENGSAIKKTSVASLEFKPSIMNGNDTLFNQDANSRLDELDKKFNELTEAVEKLGQIPLASTSSIGGIKLLSSSPVVLNDNGEADFDISKLKEVQLSAKILMTFLYNSTKAKCIYQKTCEEDTRTLLNSTAKVVSGSYNYVLFYSETNGIAYHRNAADEKTELNARNNTIYLFVGEGSEFTVKEYTRNTFRELLVEGAV